MQQQLL